MALTSAACNSRGLPITDAPDDIGAGDAAPIDLAPLVDLAPHVDLAPPPDLQRFEIFVSTLSQTVAFTNRHLEVLDVKAGTLARSRMLDDTAVGLGWGGGALWTAFHDGATLAQLDPDSLATLRTIAAGSVPEALAVTADGALAYAISDDGAVHSYDLHAGVEIDRLAIPSAATGMTSPYVDVAGLALSPDEHALGVTAFPADADHPQATIVFTNGGQLSLGGTGVCNHTYCSMAAGGAFSPDGQELVLFGGARFWGVHTSDGSLEPDEYAVPDTTCAFLSPAVLFDADGLFWNASCDTIYRGSFTDASRRATVSGTQIGYPATVLLDRLGTSGWVITSSQPAAISRLDTRSATLTPLAWDLSAYPSELARAIVYVER